MIIRYIVAWFGLTIIAIANGSLRQFVYGPVMPELTAHQVSTLTGLIFFGLFIRFICHTWPLATAGQAWGIGFLWLGMTVGFEFIFGHYVIGHPWSHLLHDYNLFAGRVWIVVLIWTVIAPRVFWKKPTV